MAVVGAPSYFKSRPEPKRPQDLIGAQLHQFASADPRQPICLGIRKRQPRAEGARRWPTDLQRRPELLSAALAGLGWPMCPKAWCRRISPRAVSSAYSRIGASPIRATTFLSEPPPILRGVRPGGRCATLSAVMQRASQSAANPPEPSKRIVSRLLVDRGGLVQDVRLVDFLRPDPSAQRLRSRPKWTLRQTSMWP